MLQRISVFKLIRSRIVVKKKKKKTQENHLNGVPTDVMYHTECHPSGILLFYL